MQCDDAGGGRLTETLGGHGRDRDSDGIYFRITSEALGDAHQSLYATLQEQLLATRPPVFPTHAPPPFLRFGGRMFGGSGGRVGVFYTPVRFSF